MFSAGILFDFTAKQASTYKLILMRIYSPDMYYYTWCFMQIIYKLKYSIWYTTYIK